MHNYSSKHFYGYGNNCGNGERACAILNSLISMNLDKSIYRECGMNQDVVDYVKS